MDAGLITPFAQSIQNVFSMMLQLPVTAADPVVRTGDSPAHGVSGIIGMSGDVTGSVALSLRTETALAIVELFCGERLDPADPDFADAIGELVNMICGGAKAMFGETRSVSISCPSVIVGEGHGVAMPSDIPCIAIPCSTEFGEFVIEVAIRDNTAAIGAGRHTAAGARSTRGETP